MELTKNFIEPEVVLGAVQHLYGQKKLSSAAHPTCLPTIGMYEELEDIPGFAKEFRSPAVLLAESVRRMHPVLFELAPDLTSPLLDNSDEALTGRVRSTFTKYGLSPELTTRILLRDGALCNMPYAIAWKATDIFLTSLGPQT
ncbi:MAG TPA: hypothetical protein VHB93_01985 [Candidatus Paceibacterota bacterium]|nr:hypothetical protein [Candidatus Paceibacterota bacterium]